MPLSHRDFEHLRQSGGLTQEQLADRIGVVRSAISKIEHATRELSFAEAVRWAEACGASLAIVNAQVDDVLHHLSALTGPRLTLAMRIVMLLPRLEDPHVVTLEVLVSGWEKLDSSRRVTQEQAGRRVG